ncbi:hypothetical protein L1987_50915 [Smallanthus sonchifolius]|uniref:Uncharacterized protein n=1 Tax=Smallanthus sonchifolius TaxID=185202 RepID=A0ACB9EPF9_9ASTR|nr:hypothetical protein L1987_50915 [Smallanthus sonchifolius]
MVAETEEVTVEMGMKRTKVVAREVGGFVVDMIRQKKIAGRGFLLARASGTNKTALALSISQELAEMLPQ